MQKGWIITSLAIFIVFIGIITMFGTTPSRSFYGTTPNKDFFDISKKEIVDDLIIEKSLLDDRIARNSLIFTNHINPITGVQTEKVTAKAVDEQILEKEFVVNEGESPVIIEYILKEDEIVPVHDTDFSFPFTSIPNTDEILIEKDFNIYKTDWENGILEEVIDSENLRITYKDKVERFENQPNRLFVTAENPTLNPTGTHLLFYSTRGALFEEEMESHRYIWIKDFTSGDIYPLKLSVGIFSLAGWRDEHNAVIQTVNGTFNINVKTGDYTVLAEADEVGLLNDHIVYQSDSSGSITLQEINTGHKKVIKESFIDSVFNINSNGQWIVFSNFDDDSGDRSILMYSIEKDTWKELIVPVTFPSFWITLLDDDTLLVSTTEQGYQLRYYAHLININDVEVIK